jgi:hypothetical protein
MIPRIKSLKETAFAEVAFLVHGNDLREIIDYYLPHIQPVTVTNETFKNYSYRITFVNSLTTGWHRNRSN